MRTLPLLYVKADPEPGELQQYPGFRTATAEEIGTVVQHLRAGNISVRVGKIEIVAEQDGVVPGSIYARNTFLIGQDAKVTIDGQPYAERTGLRLESVEFKIERNKALFIRVEGTPACES